MLSRVIDSNESKNLLARVCMLKFLSDFVQKNIFINDYIFLVILNYL